MINYSKYLVLGSVTFLLAACTAEPTWHLKLAHTADGEVTAGSSQSLVDAVRSGCQIRVAWGARRAADPTRTIEHIATPGWISVRDGETVEVQLDGFMTNLGVLGEPAEDHPRRERFGGTQKAVSWKANLKTDGSFDAIWYSAHTGDLVEKIPQTHPMKWFADCGITEPSPLYPPSSTR